MFVPVMEVGRVRMGVRLWFVAVRVAVPAHARRFPWRMVMLVVRIVMGVAVLVSERSVLVEMPVILTQ